MSLEGTFLLFQQSIRAQCSPGAYRNSRLYLQNQLTALLNPKLEYGEHDQPVSKPGSPAS